MALSNKQTQLERRAGRYDKPQSGPLLDVDSAKSLV